MTGEFEKQIKEKVDSGLDAVNETIWEQFMKIVTTARKELVLGAYKSWVSPDEPKPAIKYICIEYEKFEEWFGKEVM